MNRLKLLTYSVIGLFLLNVGILFFLFFSRPNRNPEQNNRRPKEIIIEKLQFNSNQIDKYESIIKIYKDQIDSLDRRNKEIKSELYSQLKSPIVNNVIKDSIINLFLANQKRIEESHFKHFQDIKSICNASQLKDFNILTEELGKMFSNQNSRPHGPSGKSSRNEDFQRPPRDKNQPKHPHWEEDRPGHPCDENLPTPKTKFDDEK